MFDKIVDSCRYLLQHYPGAQPCREYLDSRLSSESQEKFKFGYFPDSNNLQVLIDLVGKDLLEELKLAFPRRIFDSLGPRAALDSYFENNPLILPLRNTYGEAVGLMGRTLLTEEEMKKTKGVYKYKNTQESEAFKKGNLLFGLYENKQDIIKNDSVYIVEGQFDVIKATERGYSNIVGLGTSSMTFYQFSVISRYTNNIIMLLDNDEAGQRGRKSIIKNFAKYANIQDFYLPDNYKDIDEYLRENQDGAISFIVKN